MDLVFRGTQRRRPGVPSNMAKRGKSPRNMSGCRWNMVSMGFWRPAGQGRARTEGEDSPRSGWSPGPPRGLTEIGFLQKYLCKGPADATDE